MTEASIVTAAVASGSSSYRVKFAKTEFLDLVQLARPRIIYKRKNMHFFAYDGFVMYGDQCSEGDFSQRIIEAIEFSNYDWAK
jgi:hypothetical protein